MTTAAPGFPRLLQDYFLSRLATQRGASRHTIASYRDTFTLLLRFIEDRTRRAAASLGLADLDAPLVLDFLDYLEEVRGNSARTRNARLTAIRSFLRYAASRDPASLAVVQRVLAIPTKRFDRPVLGYMTREEMQAVIDAPDRTTFTGHRDAVLFTTLYNTGARVSETVALRRTDIMIDRQASLVLHGKGRKERIVPLWPSTATLLRRWLSQTRADDHAPVFVGRNAQPLSRSGVRQRLARAVAKAATQCPSLARRRVSPHTIRHTTAMHLLQAGVDLTVIAMLLGHEDPSTTHRYLESDLAMKQAALDRIAEPSARSTRFRTSDRVLAFLEGL